MIDSTEIQQKYLPHEKCRRPAAQVRKIVHMAANTDLVYASKFYGMSKANLSLLFKQNGHLCLIDPDKGKGKSFKEIQELFRDEMYKPTTYTGQETNMENLTNVK